MHSDPPERAPEVRSRLRGWQKAVVLLAAMVGAPALFFVTVELVLRVAGYGYPTAYFIPWEVEGQPAYVNNLKFRQRFFPRGLERPTHPAVVSANKAEDTIRVFILGASAAMGEPDMNFGFSRILEVLLKHQYPGTRFEVINTSMAAINSHVVLPIARDCARRDPDLFIVYLGNNEVVGPFGAGSVFKSSAANMPLIRAGLAIKRTKTGQAVDELLQRFGAQTAPKTWLGVEMFIDKQVRHDDPRMEAVYRNFRRNLADIAEAAVTAGARAILCTVAVNESDFAPLGSLHAPGLDEAQRASWQNRYDTGITLEEDGDWAGALERYSEAEALDGTYAELQFRLGRCARALGRYEEAVERFALARDLDTLRFRADSRINEAIRAVGTQMAAEGVLLADVDRAFSEEGQNGMVGSEFFHEHVHLTFAGNYLLARTVLEQVVSALPDSLDAAELDESNFLDEKACARRLALTGWDRAKHLEGLYRLMARPPFTNQCGHDARMAELEQRRKALRPKLGQAGRAEAVAAYRRALRAVPDDVLMRQRLGNLLGEHGDPVAAEEELRRVIRRMPHDFASHISLARALIMQKAYDKAEAVWRELLEVYPDSPDSHAQLALVLWAKGHLLAAIDEFRAALAIDPFRADLHLALGRALIQHGDRTAAIEHLRAAIELSPADPRARALLAKLLKD